MPISTGSRLSPYEILEQIGAGGMGEVYRARDTILKREVALKVLPEAFAHNIERMARFQREAEVLASLNHPNIASIYGVAESGDTRALVMELVEGPTLAGRIKEGAIPQEESLAIARQIADALEYAHEKGVVHRDLKPANIKITPEGTVKLLDFGLAKAFSEPSPGGDPSNSPTLTMGETRAGVILGTAAYMAPEQARGKQADKRADIWAFGVVLAEMLTGKRLFTGELMSDILAAVIAKEPDLEALPAPLRPVIQKCLRKDPRMRWRDIGDVRMALLEDVGQAISSPAISPATRSPAPPWIIAGVAIACAAALAFLHFRETPPVAQPVRLQIPVPEGMAFNAGTFAISPDGRKVVFGAGATNGPRQLWVRELDSLELKPLTGTEIPVLTPPPFWSPDSRFIAFGAEGKLKKVPVSGGPPQTICDTQAGATGGAWNKDGVIVFGSNALALRQCAASGGPVSPVTVLAQGETAHRFPQFLPDGRRFLFTRTSNAPEKTGVFVGSLDAKPAEQDMKPVLITDRQAYYVPSDRGGAGWLLFMRDATLMAQPFDPAKLALSGEPTPIASSLGSFAAALNAFFNVSDTGALVYRGGGGGQLQLTWFDAQGKTSTVGEPSLWARPAVSPDGTRVAASQLGPQGNGDIWVLDNTRGTSTRLTFDPARDDDAVWSPDGARIVFASNRGGRFDLYVKASDGSGDDQLLLKTDEDKLPESWSRDGRYLLYHTHGPKTGDDLWVLPLEGDRKPFPFLRTEFGEYAGQFSPDTRWIAYTSNESGTFEVYVRPFSPDSGSGLPASGGKWMVSKGGGGFPQWRADGKQLFYRSLPGTIMAVDVTSGKSFQAGVPVRLFDSGFPVVPLGYNGMTADGKRFLFPLTQGATGAPPPFTVLLNWQAGLKR